MNNMEISDDLYIIECDDIDTVDSLLLLSDISEDSNSNSLDTEISSNEINNSSLEKISLSSISSNFNTNIYFTESSNEEVLIEELEQEEVFISKNECEDIKSSLEMDSLEKLKNELLEPFELLLTLEDLRESSKKTVKKLRELKTVCEQAIVDIEHKLEFEEFTMSEGYSYSLLIKELRIKRRFIKNTLDKYDAISQTLSSLDKNLGKTFLKSQLRALNKVIKIQAARQYTPRILKNLEISGKASMEDSLDTLENEISSILKSANASA